MKAEIIVIGDEILLGQVVDTNSAWIAQCLAEEGVPVHRITKIGDDEERIVEAFESAVGRSELIISCGGLGPTHDDRTRFAVARFLGVELDPDANALDEIRTMYEKAGRTMGATNAVQALIPRTASFLSNHVGTAPGLHFGKGAATCFCIQGVPKEMEWMVRRYVLPFAKAHAGVQVLKYRVIRVTGVPESSLYEKTKTVVEKHAGVVDVAFLPKTTVGVDIRLTVNGTSAGEASSRIADTEKDFLDAIHAHFEHAVYGFDHDTMEKAVAELLFRSGLSVATAESCTGGLLAHRLTNVSGSSGYFLRGVTAYSNESKIDLLNVASQTIEDHGAVSEEVAKSMAVGIRERSGADIGLSTTGIAGPTGATPAKPVGLVYIGLATKAGVKVHRPLILPYPLDRVTFKERTSQTALDLLRKHLLRETSREGT